MSKELVKLIESETLISAYEGFIESLEGQKIQGRVLNNYHRYLVKEKKRYAALLKSIQKSYPLVEKIKP